MKGCRWPPAGRDAVPAPGCCRVPPARTRVSCRQRPASILPPAPHGVRRAPAGMLARREQFSRDNVFSQAGLQINFSTGALLTGFKLGDQRNDGQRINGFFCPVANTTTANVPLAETLGLPAGSCRAGQGVSPQPRHDRRRLRAGPAAQRHPCHPAGRPAGRSLPVDRGQSAQRAFICAHRHLVAAATGQIEPAPKRSPKAMALIQTGRKPLWHRHAAHRPPDDRDGVLIRGAGAPTARSAVPCRSSRQRC